VLYRDSQTPIRYSTLSNHLRLLILPQLTHKQILHCAAFVGVSVNAMTNLPIIANEEGDKSRDVDSVLGGIHSSEDVSPLIDDEAPYDYRPEVASCGNTTEVCDRDLSLYFLIHYVRGFLMFFRYLVNSHMSRHRNALLLVEVTPLTFRAPR
jgi:hypothetical protein